MISNGVGSFVNFIPVILGVVLLGAALGGSLLSPARRAQVEKYLLRPLFTVILAAAIGWCGYETWRDVAEKHPGDRLFLHIGLAVVLAWLFVETLRRTIRAFREPADTPPASSSSGGAA